MKKIRFKAQQIIYLLKQVEAGAPVKEICRRKTSAFLFQKSK